MTGKIQELPFILIPLARGKHIAILPNFCKVKVLIVNILGIFRKLM